MWQLRTIHIYMPGFAFLLFRGPLCKVEKTKGVLTGEGLDGLTIGLR